MAKKKMIKQKTSKTSSVKQRNRLRNKGKLKTKKHASKDALLRSINRPVPIMTEDEHITDDIVSMVDEDDIAYLEKSIKQRKYNLLKPIRITNKSANEKKNEDEDDPLEQRYESSQSVYQQDYNTKLLLPIKTKDGIQKCYTDITEKVSEVNEKEETPKEETFEMKEEVSWLDTSNSNDLNFSQPLSMAEIFARREEVVQNYKLRIGVLSSSLLENPEAKIGNLSLLLEIMDKRDPELQIVIRKLVAVSLLEIFKDLIPAYQIKHQDVHFNKLKKVTQQLIGYESILLKGYKEFLVKLDKMSSCLRRKKGDNRIYSKSEKGVGILAVKCLCELLITHPYFNYSEDVVHSLTLFLDNSDENIRKMVEDYFKRIFQEDKRGFISLVIVRRINHLVKSRAHSVHCEVLAVLLSLRIKNVNLDQEKEDEIKSKKFMTRRQKLLTMSKRERKRKKELEKLEREMLEVKAEENKKSKEQYMTEITKMVFLIYFRILKTAPRSNLLSITLEGLAKFAHCINLEYYQDIVNLLDRILDKEELNIREQLYCIKTVFIILSGQGDVLNIDPLCFYTHLYRIMLSIHAGKTQECADILLSTLETVLVHKRKKITTQRMLSFTKRLGTLALQLLHNGSLGALSVIKSTVQCNKAADLLLDVDSHFGQGIYNPELNEPEYCNAGNTALWELCALRRHYHPVVQKISDHVSYGAPTAGEGSLPSDLMKLNSVDFYKQYDSSSVSFKPAVPPPSRSVKGKRIKLPHSFESNFMLLCSEILNNVPDNSDFSSLLTE